MGTQAGADRVGHLSIQMTFALYGHLFEDREGDREAMKKLEAAIVAAWQLGTVEGYRLSKPSKYEPIIDLKRPTTRGMRT